MIIKSKVSYKITVSTVGIICSLLILGAAACSPSQTSESTSALLIQDVSEAEFSTEVYPTKIYSSESEPSSTVTVLSPGSQFYNPSDICLIGEKGSPEWEAVHEWESFYWTYFFQHDDEDNGDCNTQPTDYYDLYGCWSQEMKIKLDEILKKYDLKPHHTETYVSSFEALCEGVGIQRICPNLKERGDNSYKTAHDYQYYDDGSFQVNRAIDWNDHDNRHTFELNRYVYGILHSKVLADFSNFKEWEYTTVSGIKVIAYERTEPWRNTHYNLIDPSVTFIIKRPESVVVISINYDGIYDNDNHITGYKTMSRDELTAFLEDIHLENIP